MRRLWNVDLDIRATVPTLLELAFLLPGTPLVATLPEHMARPLARLIPVKTFPLPFDMPASREVLL